MSNLYLSCVYNRLKIDLKSSQMISLVIDVKAKIDIGKQHKSQFEKAVLK